MANALDDRLVLVQRVAAAHSREDFVVAGLQGKAEGFAYLRQLGDGVDDAVGQVGRVGGEEADPLEAIDGVEGVKQVGEVRRSRQVAAEGFDGLTEQGHLANAAVDEMLHLVANVVDCPAALAAAAVGDDAVGAELVAAVDDRHKGGGAVGVGVDGVPEGRRGASFRQAIDAKRGGDIVEGLRGREGVDVGEAALEAVEAGANHAAGEDDLDGGVFRLQPLRLG